MTRKDYELIAKAVKLSYDKLNNNTKWAKTVQRCHAETLADSLATDNPRFDRDRFLKACGVE